MFGVLTRQASDLDVVDVERTFYEVKDVSGRADDPRPAVVNAISCFADNAAARDDPDVVPVSETGERATPDRPYFDWSYVCPSHAAYREGLLEIVEDCVAVADDLRLDDVAFPRHEYCHCDRCTDAYAAWRAEHDAPDTHESWFRWRAATIESFVAAVRDRVPGRLYLTLYPDPYPGHVYRRAGTDPAALAAHVDEFVVPIYDTAYATTYWVETLASGFTDELAAPFSIELYAANVDVDRLVAAAEVAGAYAKDVLFGYDVATARAAIRRIDAEDRDGVRHEP